MKLLKRDTLREQRKIIYGALIAVAIFLSPGPDGISGLMVAAVLVMLFEEAFWFQSIYRINWIKYDDTG